MLAATVTSSTPRVIAGWRSTTSRLRWYARNSPENTLSLARYSRPCFSSGSCLSSLAHIIGVVVSETSSETRMATDKVTANSRNSRPTMPPMRRMGVNTATSETLTERTVNPIARALQGRLHRGHALLDVAHHVFADDDRVVDDEAGGHRERHQRQVVQRVPAEEHHRERPDQRYRDRHGRDQGRAPVSQEDEDHQDDQGNRRQKRALHFIDGRPDGGGLVEDDGPLDGGGDRCCKLGERRPDAVDGVDDVRPRLAE